MTEKPLSDQSQIFDDNQVQMIQNTALQAHTGQAIVRATVLENHLRLIIQLNMPNLSNRMQPRLFEGYGPLAAFSAKIDMAFALGLIAEDDHRALHVIRKIRNEFAHSPNGMHFNHQDLKPLLSKLPPISERHSHKEEIERLNLFRFLAVSADLDYRLSGIIYELQASPQARPKK